MYYVYTLLSKVNRDLYIGSSKDLRNRFNGHNAGRVHSTKPYRPWILVYYEAYREKSDASRREVQLKQHRAKQDLKMQIKSSISKI